MIAIKKILFFILLFISVFLLSKNISNAETTNIYVINNVQPQSLMCTKNNTICTNGYFIMSTGIGGLSQSRITKTDIIKYDNRLNKRNGNLIYTTAYNNSPVKLQRNLIIY